MSSPTRRTYLATLGAAAVGGLAGCDTGPSDEPPAGSLRLENRDSVPHTLTMRVTDVGTGPGGEPDAVVGDPTVLESQRDRTAATALEPGESNTYEGVFTESVWYVVEFTLDGRAPVDDAGVTTYHPAPPDRDGGSILAGRVADGGEFSWVISSTGNLGRFEG